MAADGRVSRLRRMLALWGLYARMDVLWIARGLKASATFYFGDLLLGLSGVTWSFLLAQRFGGIGEWSPHQIVFMLGLALVVRGSLEIGFSLNVAFPSRRIGRGQLDHMLLMPQPLWMTIATDGFCPASGSGQLLAGSAVMAWALRALGLPIGAGWLALLVLHVASAAVIMLSFAYLWASLAFVAPRAAEEINSSTMRMLEQLKPFPLDGVGFGLTLGLMSVVPAGFLAWLPSRVLLGLEPSPSAWLWTPLAALGFAALATGVFRAGLGRYARTGSTRYLSHGFRR
jgi:ABC-2 type transport system permease protein